MSDRSGHHRLGFETSTQRWIVAMLLILPLCLVTGWATAVQPTRAAWTDTAGATSSALAAHVIPRTSSISCSNGIIFPTSATVSWSNSIERLGQKYAWVIDISDHAQFPPTGQDSATTYTTVQQPSTASNLSVVAHKGDFGNTNDLHVRVRAALVDSAGNPTWTSTTWRSWEIGVTSNRYTWCTTFGGGESSP